MVNNGALKVKLRKEIKEIREKLNEEERKELSRKVAENLKKLKEFQRAKTVMLYYPIKGEVDLTPLFEEIIKSGKKLLLPKVVGENILPIEIEDFACIGEGCFNIPEPIGGKIYKPEKVDFVVVPGVAFDKRGCRLGFGKGFYDRFLPRVKGFKVGVAYDFQVKEEIPCEEHDIPLDAVVTPTKIYRRTKTG
jgi:5-formyltetrahydrofolate cyclo-ligase